MRLVRIDPAGHQLDEAAASSWVRVCSAGMHGGDVTSAYRSTAEQAALRAAFLRGEGAFALPAGQSIHERGRAVDAVAPQYAWLASHGGEHGWRQTNPAEDWHYEYESTRDQHLADRTAPAPIEEEDDIMLRIAKLKDDPRVYVGDGITRRHLGPTELADLRWRIQQGHFRGSADIETVDRIDWLGKEVR